MLTIMLFAKVSQRLLVINHNCLNAMCELYKIPMLAMLCLRDEISDVRGSISSFSKSDSRTKLSFKGGARCSMLDQSRTELSPASRLFEVLSGRSGRSKYLLKKTQNKKENLSFIKRTKVKEELCIS